MKLRLSKPAIAMIATAISVAAVADFAASKNDDPTGAELIAPKAPRSRSGREAITSALPLDLDAHLAALNTRTATDADVVDLFPVVSYRPPPAPPPPPPKPVAPPFPYAVIGTLTDSDQTIYLSSPTRVIPAKVSQVIDGAFRIDSLDAGHITVTYLPLQTRQVVAFGGSP